MSSTPIVTGPSSGLQVYDPMDSSPWNPDSIVPVQNGTPQQWKELTLQQIPMPVSGSTSGYYNGISNNGIPHPVNQLCVPYEGNGNVSNGYSMLNNHYPVRTNGLPANVNGNGYFNPMNNAQYMRSPSWVTVKKVTNGTKKPKRNRTAFTTQQVVELEQQYFKTRYLDRNRRIELSEALHLDQRTIKIWFQNRRMKEKKDRAESLEEAAESVTKSSPELIDDSMPALTNDQYNFAVAPADVFGIGGVYMENCPITSTQNVLPNQLMHSQKQPQNNQFLEYIAEYPVEHNNGAELKQVHVQVEHLAPAYANGANQVHEQVPVHVPEDVPLPNQSDENWDLSWIRNIDIDEL